ncbi:MAG: nuclear transport factor 2 family protein [Rhodospirillaceae bacterium]|nr:nuclear transport factor 2 family protein [Rhodospirillaceae bacterium]
MKSRDERLDEMLAKDEIRDVLMRYGRGVDRADAALLASCYHDGAIEEHGSTYSGPAAAYIQGAVPRIRSMSALAHYICNISISLEGSRAYVESYVLTFARFRKETGSFDTLTGGRICDRFERRNGEWRIAHRKMAFDWNFDTPSNEGWCVGLFNPKDPRMVMGQKGPEDLSYQRF